MKTLKLLVIFAVVTTTCTTHPLFSRFLCLWSASKATKSAPEVTTTSHDAGVDHDYIIQTMAERAQNPHLSLVDTSKKIESDKSGFYASLKGPKLTYVSVRDHVRESEPDKYSVIFWLGNYPHSIPASPKWGSLIHKLYKQQQRARLMTYLVDTGIGFGN